jgi:hypothetical protein
LIASSISPKSRRSTPTGVLMVTLRYIMTTAGSGIPYVLQDSSRIYTRVDEPSHARPVRAILRLIPRGNPSPRVIEKYCETKVSELVSKCRDETYLLFVVPNLRGHLTLSVRAICNDNA